MMMGKEEQEKKIFEEMSKIKHIFEKFLGYKITKKNFKKAIVDFVPLLTTRFADDSELADEERTALSDFFTICNPHLGDIIWANTKEKILNISIAYEDHALTSWHIPISVLFQNEDAFKTCMGLLIKGFGDSLFAFFLSPEWRQLVINGDEEAIKLLYSSFNRPSMSSCLSNLIMIKECFPDFYEHITTKMDIMTVEAMEEFIKNKNSKNVTNRTKKR